jgi:hypothetical protein
MMVIDQCLSRQESEKLDVGYTAQCLSSEFQKLSKNILSKFIRSNWNYLECLLMKQAGAELCQAQIKLGWPASPFSL